MAATTSGAVIQAGHPQLQRAGRAHGASLAALLYPTSCLHGRPVSLAGGGSGLGTMRGRQIALDMLAAAGFGDVTVHSQPDDLISDTCLACR